MDCAWMVSTSSQSINYTNSTMTNAPPCDFSLLTKTGKTIATSRCLFRVHFGQIQGIAAGDSSECFYGGCYEGILVHDYIYDLDYYDYIHDYDYSVGNYPNNHD